MCEEVLIMAMKKKAALCMCLLLVALLSVSCAVPASQPASLVPPASPPVSSESLPAFVPPALPQPVDFTLEGYELLPVNQAAYTNYGRGITFENLPQTTAELALANLFLVEITGEHERKVYLDYYTHTLYGKDSQLLEELTAMSAEDGSFESIVLHALRELSAVEMAEAVAYPDGPPLFEYLYGGYGEDKSYDDYVGSLYDLGVRVVYVKVTDQYTEAARMQGPQLPDGHREEYYLMLPDSEGNLCMYQRGIWGPF